ncbi:MAG: hypothetical protein DRI90_26100, partial [Deltaproteobacteria bacterium]
NRGVVSSRISTRSLRERRGSPALWAGVAVLMAALGAVAAWAMFWPAAAAPGSANPATAPSGTATVDEPAEEQLESPWANADPVEAPSAGETRAGETSAGETRATPSAETSARPKTSTGTGKGSTGPPATSQQPPPPDPEEDKPQAEIRSPFD